MAATPHNSRQSAKRTQRLRMTTGAKLGFENIGERRQKKISWFAQLALRGSG